MNILRKSRKSRIKLDKRRVVLLIFSLIMSIFAWITYSKILLPNVKVQINSWNISIYVDENKNGVAESTEEKDKTLPIDIAPFEIYPGMNEEVMSVIIKNNGETPSTIDYIISEINFVGNEYSVEEDAIDYRNTHPGEFCLQENTYEDVAGIVTYKLINETDLIPFEFVIEHTDTVDGGAEGYLKVMAVWDATIPGGTPTEIDEKNELDGKWGYDVATFVEGNATTPPIQFKLKINATGQPRSSRFVLTQDITPDNYGDYVNYGIDLNNDGDMTNDWKIFYEDNENIYIIAANYLKSGKVPTTIMTGHSEYSAYIPESKLIETTIEKEKINKYMLKNVTSSANNNYKATANLLNASDWNEDDFKITSLADSAVGTPTLEMFVRSWNQKYNGDGDYSELKYSWNKQDLGYKINDQYEFSVEGHNDADLYFLDANGATTGYWLASPSKDDKLIQVKSDGTIAQEDPISYNGCGIRPVVCLKSGLKGTLGLNAAGTANVWTLVQP